MIPEPIPCPFCGRALIWQEGELKKLPPVFPGWRHPVTDCFADMFLVVPEDVQRWNRRARS